MIKKVTVYVLLLALSVSVHAQNTESATKKAGVSKKVSQESRGARLKQLKKKEIVLPEVKLGFEDKKHKW